MNYKSVKEISILWNISERSVRLYCQQGRVIGAYQNSGVWYIPSNADKPNRKPRKISSKRKLLDVLKDEKELKINGGIYNKLQVEITFNSNFIEGNTLGKEQVAYIFETNTIGVIDKSTRIDDLIETINHFRCIDYIIDNANYKLSESMIKQLHYLLKVNTTDSTKTWFNVGSYKLYENEVGNRITTPVEDVKDEMVKLLNDYNSKKEITIFDIISFHQKFESIHPFQDGNGRVGRLIMLKECLKNNIVPVLITEENKYFYYRGLDEWEKETGYLIDTCLAGQDIMKKYLDYFKIKY